MHFATPHLIKALVSFDICCGGWWQAKEAGTRTASGQDPARLGAAGDSAASPSLPGRFQQPLLSPGAQDVLRQQRHSALWQQQPQQAAEQRLDRLGGLEASDGPHLQVPASRSTGAFVPLLRGSPAGQGMPQHRPDGYASRQAYNLHT